MSKKDKHHQKEKDHKDKEKKGKKDKMSNKEYEKEIAKLQGELVKVQRWLAVSKERIIVLFEGRDAAGKGGVIKRITERVSPRVFRTAALPAPSEREKTQLYLQRYIQHFPAGGEVVLFDRSWYNRAGVEPVMGFCTPEQTVRFLQYAPVFEQMIVEGGVKLIKYWFEVGMEEQERRFRSRIEDPRKIWKLSPMDVESYRRWYDYSRARDAILMATDRDLAPWHIVRTDDKKRARLNCISHLLSQIDYEDVPLEDVDLGKRDVSNAYDDRAALEGRNWIPEKY
jgi:polyphosphate kinase 2